MKIKLAFAGKRKLKLLWRSLFLLLTFWLVLLSLHLVINLGLKLPRNAYSKTDAILVLGGSISREIYAAQLAKEFPQIPILIARGSPDPCILKVFQRINSPIKNVWLEVCSRSTFTNFVFGLPILESWQIHKVKLITSGTHIRRSQWMARIILGSHGIWVDLDIAPEKGVPGNHESWTKTTIDLTRSVIWAFLGQVIQPQCNYVYPLSQVNFIHWKSRRFTCERQGILKD